MPALQAESAACPAPTKPRSPEARARAAHLPARPSDLPARALTTRTFERAFQPEALLAYDGERDYFRYLAQIARNALVSQYRRTGREIPAGGRDSWAEGEIAESDLQDEPAPQHENPRAIDITREYTANLPEPLRAIHTARYREGLTERAAVMKLGVTRWFLQSREQRLRRELLSLLKKAGVA